MPLNAKGQVKELLEAKGQTLESVGFYFDDGEPCTVDLTYSGRKVCSQYHSTKKEAAQDAYAQLLGLLKHEPIKAPVQHFSPPSALAVQAKAMKGDAILRLILIDHFTSENPAITPCTLNRSCVSYSTNRFLLDNYARLDCEYEAYAPGSKEQILGLSYIDDDHILLPHLSGLGPQLPLPTGERKDATNFEAWIAERFEHNSNCYQQTKYDVLPALGFRLD